MRLGISLLCGWTGNKHAPSPSTPHNPTSHEKNDLEKPIREHKSSFMERFEIPSCNAGFSSFYFFFRPGQIFGGCLLPLESNDRMKGEHADRKKDRYWSRSGKAIRIFENNKKWFRSTPSHYGNRHLRLANELMAAVKDEDGWGHGVGSESRVYFPSPGVTFCLLSPPVYLRWLGWTSLPQVETESIKTLQTICSKHRDCLNVWVIIITC